MPKSVKEKARKSIHAPNVCGCTKIPFQTIDVNSAKMMNKNVIMDFLIIIFPKKFQKLLFEFDFYMTICEIKLASKIEN